MSAGGRSLVSCFVNTLKENSALSLQEGGGKRGVGTEIRFLQNSQVWEGRLRGNGGKVDIGESREGRK